VHFLSEVDEVVQLRFADGQIDFALERGQDLRAGVKGRKIRGEIKGELREIKRGCTWDIRKLEGRNLAFNLGFSFKFYKNS
jgi:hypothetical protein